MDITDVSPFSIRIVKQAHKDKINQFLPALL